MVPLIPALALAFLSFIASAFVILRIIIPILPTHRLNKRVSPAKFGLPRFRSLSTANKGHIWLAALDLIGLGLLMWQEVAEAMGAPLGLAAASDPLSSVRLWVIMSIRQTCLMIITAIVLLHIRLGRPVSFGKIHWLLWVPTMSLVIASTAFAGTFSGARFGSLFIGLAAYTSTVAILTTVAFGCIVRTLYNIKRNLAAVDEGVNRWPHVKQTEERRRPSFSTEEIDAIKEGTSWITSNPSSRRNSISTWSFSTHHTAAANSHHGHGRPRYLSNGNGLGDPDPFRGDVSTSSHERHHQRQSQGSQTSWLTSTNRSHSTMSAWSFPATDKDGSIHSVSTPDLHEPVTITGPRPMMPVLGDSQVGGYGFTLNTLQAEKGLAPLAPSSSTITEVTTGSIFGWLVTIWLPFGLGFPYFIFLSQGTTPNMIFAVLLVLSVTLSSPLLALNIIFHCPLPIPVGLVEPQNALRAEIARRPSHMSTLLVYNSHESKCSMSTSPTVIEGRRSGDVWITKGVAVGGKNKIGRAVEMLRAMPKLSVLPPEESEEVVPIRGEPSLLVGHHRSQSDTSAQFGRARRESEPSSHFSGVEESLSSTAEITVAQRHYSALAQTVAVSNSEKGNSGEPNQLLSATTGIIQTKPSAHFRTRPISSISGSETGSPANSIVNIPSDPLPPTPPKVQAAHLAQLKHKKSISSGFSFGPVGNVNEIDALTAGVLPWLVPGLKVGDNMKIKNELPGMLSKLKSRQEFGEEFSSPEIHSTLVQRGPREPRGWKQSNHKNCFSLPSLGGRDIIHSPAAWSAEIQDAIGHRVGQCPAVDVGKRNTVFGADSIPNYIPLAHLHAAKGGEERPTVPLTRSLSTRSLGLRADISHNEAKHPPLNLYTMLPPASVASSATLFEDFGVGLGSPLAESTPQNTVPQKPKSRHPPPPLPLIAQNSSA